MLVPQTLAYERFIVTNGYLAEGDLTRLQAPYDFVEDGSLSEIGAEEVPDTLFVNLAFINAASQGRIPPPMLERIIADLEHQFSDLPRNDLGVQAIRFCPTRHRARQRMRFARFPVTEDSRTNRIPFQQWVAYVRNNQELFNRPIIRRSVPVVVVDSRDEFLGFTSAARTSLEGGDAIVTSRRTLHKELQRRDKSGTLAHLIANHLGLPPLWAQRGREGDHVADTPIQLEPNFGRVDSAGYVHVAMAPGLPPELASNPMDNTWDEEDAPWTRGQVELLIGSMQSERLRKYACPAACGQEEAPARDTTARLVVHVDSSEQAQPSLRLAPNPLVTDQATLYLVQPGVGSLEQLYDVSVVTTAGEVVEEAEAWLSPLEGRPIAISVQPGTYFVEAVSRDTGERLSVEFTKL